MCLWYALRDCSCVRSSVCCAIVFHSRSFVCVRVFTARLRSARDRSYVCSSVFAIVRMCVRKLVVIRMCVRELAVVLRLRRTFVIYMCSMVWVLYPVYVVLKNVRCCVGTFVLCYSVWIFCTHELFYCVCSLLQYFHTHYSHSHTLFVFLQCLMTISHFSLVFCHLISSLFGISLGHSATVNIVAGHDCGSVIFGLRV